MNLSSIAHVHTYEDGIQFDKINDQPRLVSSSVASWFEQNSSVSPIAYRKLIVHADGSSSYSDKRAYGQSKLANILHANELARRLQVILLLVF